MNELFWEIAKVTLSNFQPSTRLIYAGELRLFEAWLGETALQDIKPVHAMRYLGHVTSLKSKRNSGSVAPNTIRRKIESLYSIYEGAKDSDLVSENPFSKVADRVRAMRRDQLFPTKLIEFPDVREKIAACKHPRNAAILAVLFGGGLRVSELCGLKRSDVVECNNTLGLKVLGAKTGITRPVLLPEWAGRILKKYTTGLNRENIPLFSTPRDERKPLSRRHVSTICSDVFGARAHAARATHITYQLTRGVPIVDVARSVGHTSVETTQIYDKRILKFDNSATILADYSLTSYNYYNKKI